MNASEFENNMTKVAAGDKSALKNIYDEFNCAVYTLALSILHNNQYAEDVSQEIFVKVWENADSLCHGRNPRAWIMETTRNQSIDFLRKIKHEIVTDKFEDLNKNYSANREPFNEYILDKISVQEILSVLTDEKREIFIMHVLGGLTYKEISKVLKISFGKVLWNYKSSIKILQKQLSNINLKEDKCHETNV